jgi:hypothetical protein
LAVKLHEEGEVLDADIINASAGGCLLACTFPLEPGGIIEASIPELLIPRTKLHIVRCQATPSGYLVAAHFDAAVNDESPIAQLTSEQQGDLAHLRWLN